MTKTKIVVFCPIAIGTPVSLAKAVAASSAFPPVLSPCTLEVDPSEFVSDPKCPLQEKPFTSDIVLSDGGVYDNMGIETAWKSFQPLPSVGKVKNCRKS